MTEDANNKDDPNIPTNLRLLLVLEELARADVPTTPSEVNRILGLPKATVHRLFHTLEAEGFVQRDIDGSSYSPGRRFRKLSVNALSSLRIRTARLAILRKLVNKVGETCNVASSNRTGMIYIDRVESKWPIQVQLPIGVEVPFHCTASGKLYLSTLPRSQLDGLLKALPLDQQTPNTITNIAILKEELETIRKLGYSTDNEEFIEGMVAVAVPIKDDQDRLMSALALHGPLPRFSLDDAKRHIELMHDVAADLSKLLIGGSD